MAIIAVHVEPEEGGPPFGSNTDSGGKVKI